MIKVKLDRYDLKLMVNCLYQARDLYTDEPKENITEVILFLLDRHDELKPGRKMNIRFDTNQLRIVIVCLNDWRTALRTAGDDWQAEDVSELLLKFMR